MADTYKNFNRQYRLSFGQAGQEGIEIGETTDKQPIPLHIEFNVQKGEKEAQNTGTVSVWNLSPKHLSILNEKDCSLGLRAGYGKHLSLLFAGVISHVSTSMDGADQKTEIEVVDNLVEVRDTYASISYNGEVSWEQIFKDTSEQMGVPIVFGHNVEFAKIANGYSYVGLAKDIISKGCDCCDCEWSMQNGIIQVKRPHDVMEKNVKLLNASSGLIGFPAKIKENNSEKTENPEIGYEVEFFLDGSVGVDDYLKVESKIVTGYFRVAAIEHSGDNVSGDWISKAKIFQLENNETENEEIEGEEE